jgi:hypothetical protein
MKPNPSEAKPIEPAAFLFRPKTAMTQGTPGRAGVSAAFAVKTVT